MTENTSIFEMESMDNNLQIKGKKKKVKREKTPKEKKIKQKKERKVKEKKPKEKKVKQGKQQKGKKTKKLSMFIFLVSVALLPLIISVVVVSMISYRITTDNVKQSTDEMLMAVSRNIASHCVQNEVTIINASEHYDYLDSLNSQNIQVAVIFENMSCVTSIKNTNGYRVREIECSEDLFKNPDKYKKNGYVQESVIIDEKNYYAVFMPVIMDGQVTGVAFASVPSEKVADATSVMLKTIIVIAAALLIVSIIVVLIFSRKVSKAFGRIGGRVNSLSEGDLSAQKQYKSGLREIHTLLDETQMLQSNLVDIIGKVKGTSNQLVENIGDVAGLSQDTSERAQQIVDSVDELTKGAELMNENVQDISEQMQEIGICVNEMSDSVKQLYQHSENILDTNNVAKDNMTDIMDKSQKSVQAVESIAEQINATNVSIERVDEAVAMILSISEETNLLSLNASIEAARAGEHGRGFAVIAEEIFELSEQSAKGAEMIKQLARAITEDSQKSVNLASQVQTMIFEEQDSIKLTQQKYEELSKEIGKSADEIRSIASKTNELSDYKEKVIENVHSLGAISEENAASNEEVNGNISEIIMQVKNVDENCASMNEMAHKLEEAVDFFKE